MQTKTTNTILSELQAELDAYGNGAYADRPSRLIVHDERHIYLLYKRYERVEVMTYSPEVYYFLCCPRYCSYSLDYKKMRILVEVQHRGKRGRYKTHLSRLMYQLYHNELPLDKLVDILPTVAEETEIDHANSDRCNHCFWNLSAMDKAVHQRKHDLAARIKLPYFCYYAVTTDAKYRVCFGYKTDFKWQQIFHVKCNTPELLIDFLTAVMDIDKASGWLRKYGTPTEVYKLDRKAPYAAEDFKQAACYAEMLLKMSDNNFIAWTDKGILHG